MPAWSGIAAVCLAPQFSEMSVGLYIQRTEEAAREAGVTARVPVGQKLPR